MEDKKNFSSRELLQGMVDDAKNSIADEKKIHEMVLLIQTQMEEFDIQKRENYAKSVEDLSRIVITA